MMRLTLLLLLLTVVCEISLAKEITTPNNIVETKQTTETPTKIQTLNNNHDISNTETTPSIEATQTTEPIAPTPTKFAISVDAACASCCDGGSCSYIDEKGSTLAQSSAIKFVQCCGKLENQPKCCPVNRGMSGPNLKCHADESGYVCKDGRHRLIILTESAYLSPGGLVVICVIGGILACCYCALGSRRTHAGYYGSPMYSGQPMYAGGGGGSGAGLCAACLAGFCWFVQPS